MNASAPKTFRARLRALRLPLALRARLRDVLEKFVDLHATKSYSQEGEDLVLHRIFAHRPAGYYVDVGAHHPRRFSNTYFFYKRGWHGINIEPRPDAICAFRTARNRDRNLQIGVADRAATLTYYWFDEPALNTFDAELALSRVANTPYKVLREIPIPVERLDRILEQHLPPGQVIDFLSIDVEGFDLAVLRSNDWDRFRPRCVLVEALGNSLEENMRGEVVAFLRERGYQLFGKTFNTLIFRDKSTTL